MPMSHKPISPLLRAWYKWKMLRLPWRRQFLVGLDLNGNTYWEFLERGVPRPPPPSSTRSPPTRAPTAQQPRYRRIVHYPRGTHHDSVAVSPAWHQWLRYTRADPPTLDEQRADVVRQARIKELAAAADARWEAKPRVMDAPAGRGQAMLGVRGPATLTGTGGGPHREMGKGERQREREEVDGDVGVRGEERPQERGGPETAGDRDKEAVDQREESWRVTEEGARQKKKKVEEHDPWKQARGGAERELAAYGVGACCEEEVRWVV